MREIDSRIGRFGKEARRWKGEEASYTAKHMWITKHYANEKEVCEHCSKTEEEVSRLEWANLSGEYKRERSDYICLCPSCHRKMDLKKTHCPSGHELNDENLKINSRGHRTCIKCIAEQQKRYMEKKNAAPN